MRARASRVRERRLRNLAVVGGGAALLTSAAAYATGCVECEDAYLCTRTLEMRFGPALTTPGTYSVDVTYDEHTASCVLVWSGQGVCQTDSLAGMAGALASGGSATLGGAGGTVPPTGSPLSCTDYDLAFLLDCGIAAVYFHRATPRTATLEVRRDGELVVASTLTPQYRTYQPHKKGCGNPCTVADETIEIP